jgi:5-methyltetrahydropteroyltriglutamate--homocysteine methyltransferase
MGNMTMAILNHTLGFPRVGLRRELKKAQESYWAGNSTQEELLAVGRELRARHWQQQQYQLRYWQCQRCSLGLFG